MPWPKAKAVNRSVDCAGDQIEWRIRLLGKSYRTSLCGVRWLLRRRYYRSTTVGRRL